MPAVVGRPRRRALSSLLSYSGVQVLIAASAFVRIPLLIHSLGPASFGLVNVVGAVAPLLLASSQGLRTASRTLAAEEIGMHGDLTLATRAALRRAATRTMWWQLLVVTPLILVVPFAAILRADRAVGRTELTATLVASATLCALAAPGAMRWGILEARGRISLVNSFFALVTVAGLVVTVVTAPFVHSLLFFGTLNVATTALPFGLPLLVPGERARARRAPATARRAAAEAARQPETQLVRRSVWRASLIGSARAGSPFASRALDPFVISAALGPTVAASYAVAQRLSVVGTLVPVAVLPLVSGAAARRRGAGGAVRLVEVARLGAAYTAVAVVCGVGLVLTGPRLGRLLTGGQLAGSRSLFVALAALGVASSLELALAALGTGPLAMRLGLWIDGTTAIGNVVLSLVLVRSMGLTGPVYASVIAMVVAAGAWLLAFACRPQLLTEIHGANRGRAMSPDDSSPSGVPSAAGRR